MVFRLFLDFDNKTCVFAGKFFAMLSKLLSTCPEENLQSNISQRKSWKLQDFRIIFEVFWTMVENFFRVGKTAKDIQGNSLWKKFFENSKTRFFSDSERFSTSSENFRYICETRNLTMRGSIGGETFFQLYIIFHTSLDFDPKNA